MPVNICWSQLHVTMSVKLLYNCASTASVRPKPTAVGKITALRQTS